MRSYWCPFDRNALRQDGSDLRYNVRLLFCTACGRHFTYFEGDDELPELFQTQQLMRYEVQRQREDA